MNITNTVVILIEIYKTKNFCQMHAYSIKAVLNLSTVESPLPYWQGWHCFKHCKADIMPDVMKALAKEDPFVPSVFENFKRGIYNLMVEAGITYGLS